MPELVVLAEQLLGRVPGGTGRYTEELIPALISTAPDGWTVSLAVARRSDKELEALNIFPREALGKIHRLPLPSRLLSAMWQWSIPYWPGGDAVHAPTPLAPPILPRKKTLSVTVHDTVPWTHPETLTRHGVSWHKKMISRAARDATGLIVPTHAVADDLRKHLVVKAPISIAAHGVPMRLTNSAVTDAEAKIIATRLKLPSRYVLYVGTIEPRKGIRTLIEAMSTWDSPPLVLVGPQGWGSSDPEELAKEYGLPREKLRILGQLSDVDLNVVLRNAAVLAMPSLAEGFGLPIIEAMAVGVPVVHSDAPALVEVSKNAAATFPRGNARVLAEVLQRMASDPQYSRDLIVSGHRRIVEFSWKKSAHNVWNIHSETTLRDSADFKG